MQPFEQRFVLLPGWDLWKRRAVGGFLESLALHLEICESINLGCLHIDVTEEVADDLERYATLQQVHSLCVPQTVRTHPLCEVGVIAPHRNHILLQEITYTRAR